MNPGKVGTLGSGHISEAIQSRTAFSFSLVGAFLVCPGMQDKGGWGWWRAALFFLKKNQQLLHRFAWSQSYLENVQPIFTFLYTYLIDTMSLANYQKTWADTLSEMTQSKQEVSLGAGFSLGTVSSGPHLLSLGMPRFPHRSRKIVIL